MKRLFECEIGELCRDGKAVFYAFIDGEQVETDCRDDLVRKIMRRRAERRFGRN